MALIYKVIANDEDTITLTDLYNEDTGKFYKEPAINFINAEEDRYWDNETYVLNLLQGLKKGKKKAEKEVKEFCKKNGFDYEETRSDLLDIFRQSKKLKYWKDEN